MYRRKSSILITGFLLLLLIYPDVSAQPNWSPEHVHYGPEGALTYTPDEKGNIIPDFSHVGYRYGDDSIPYIEVKAEVSPVVGDDGASIQAAIDLVSGMPVDANGFRGAVLLKKGTYEVNGQLSISASGVVLRGEGQTDAGTVILAAGTGTRDLITVGNGSSLSVDAASKVTINEAYVTVGRKFVIVTDASGFAEGDHIALYRPGTQQWISDIKMDQLTPSAGTEQWSPSTYNFYFERLVTGVAGDTIFFRNPVVMAMETIYGGGEVYKVSFNRLENIGVENLCLKSAYQSGEDEEHSWEAIAFYSVENGWVRNVTSWYFAYSCVSLERNSRLITVLDCNCREPKSIITGSRRYSFYLVGQLNLFKGCTTTEGRHDYVSSSRVCGPNVFTRCTAANTHADIGPHHRWAMGTLFDVIDSDGEINVQDRDDMGTGHGWAGANQVFWNCSGSSSICQSPWASALNYNFGFMGAKSSGARPGRPDGEWIGHNIAGLFPVSLYEAQMDARLNDTRLFSAYSELIQQDDSTFIMEFNMPLKTSTVIAENFSISGTAGLDGKPFTVSVKDEYNIQLVISDIGILPAYSTIMVSVSNLLSSADASMEGASSSLFTEPDKRPVVSGLTLTVDNQTGFLVASSSKAGFIYLVKYGPVYSDQNDLETAVSNKQGKKLEYTLPGISQAIYTIGLPGGLYNYYAVDEDGRMSNKIAEFPQIEETGPVSGLVLFPSGADFAAWFSQGKINIEPWSHQERYSIQIFEISGRLMYEQNNLRGSQQLDLNGYKGIVILRKFSSDGVSSRKLMIQ